jgi:electron transport complex protein RnfC
VRLPWRTSNTASQPIRKACVPAEVLVPLRQHAGQPATCLVSVGQTVAEGMRIGQAVGPLTADVHAPIPGVVKELRAILLPGGLPSPAVVIALEGEFRCTGRARSPADWRGLDREQLLQRLEAGGVVGANGLPAATRLQAAGSAGLLVIDGVESEPYLAGDERLLVEKAQEVLSGAAIAAAILGTADVQLGIAADKPEALRIAAEAAEGFGFRTTVLAARYPQGEEGLLVQALDRCRARPGTAGAGAAGAGAAGAAGTVVLNVGTALAVYEAVALSLPHIERVVTVAGKGVRQPANLKARLGTPVRALLEECGLRKAERFIAGGPMRGFTLENLDTPVTKGLTGVLALTRGELRPAARTPCIGCGRCGEACPWGLDPAVLFKLLEHGQPAEARRRRLGECTECGCCAFVCPARIPLVQGLAAGRRRGAA